MFTRLRELIHHPVTPCHLVRLLRYRMLHPQLARLFRNALWHSRRKEARCAAALPVSERLERSQFFYTPKNRKDFLLSTLTGTTPYEWFLDDADPVLHNTFSFLGSLPVTLPFPLPWQQDIKTGAEWPLSYYTDVKILNGKPGADIKMPWEMSRFHFAAWLGRASWVSGSRDYEKKFFQLLNDWIDANPFPYGVNWKISMEASIRSFNWLLGLAFFSESPLFTPDLQRKATETLYLHGAFIEYNLEFSPRNHNHLVSNLAGLYVLGLFFRDTPRGQRWLTLSQRFLEKEIRDEVFEDGVDYEGSISYHRLVIELFLVPYLLAERNNARFPEAYRQRLERMFEFVAAYTRPDGSAPLIGDADDGRLFCFSPSQPVNDHRYLLSIAAVLFGRSDLKRVAGRFSEDALWLLGAEGFERFLKLPDSAAARESSAFPDGGFYIMQGEEAHLIIDAGGIGLDGLGGHGHNDTFSFELFFGGVTFITDSGTYCYTADRDERQSLRSTAAHNTIRIDERELAEFSSLWHITRDTTRPRVTEWAVSEWLDAFDAEHYGYERLPRSVRVRRHVEFQKRQSYWKITDEILGSGEHSIDFFLHFSPGIQVERVDERTYLLKGTGASLLVRTRGREGVIEPWSVSPGYGVLLSSSRLRISGRSILPARLETILIGLHTDTELSRTLEVIDT